MSADSNSYSHALKYLRKSARSLKTAKIVGTVVGAILVVVSRWVADNIAFSDTPTLAPVLLWSGICLTAFGSLVLIFVDETAPEVLAKNVELEAQIEADRRSLEFHGSYSNHLLARLSVNAQVRELVEKAVTDKVPNASTLARHAAAIVEIFVVRRHSLFGIGDEYWNFSVYQHDPSTDQLKCIACRRENSDDEKDTHRNWKPGEGHVGLCFSRGTEVIFSDANRPELKPVLAASGENERGYDQERYVSLASMPISNDGEKPLGVLIATSSMPGRFKNDEERTDEEWENADTLRDVASSLAIIFRLIHANSAAGGPFDEVDEQPVTDGPS